jgi:hypothetical protein
LILVRMPRAATGVVLRTDFSLPCLYAMSPLHALIRPFVEGGTIAADPAMQAGATVLPVCIAGKDVPVGIAY